MDASQFAVDFGLLLFYISPLHGRLSPIGGWPRSSPTVLPSHISREDRSYQHLWPESRTSYSKLLAERKAYLIKNRFGMSLDLHLSYLEMFLTLFYSALWTC